MQVEVEQKKKKQRVNFALEISGTERARGQGTTTQHAAYGEHRYTGHRPPSFSKCRWVRSSPGARSGKADASAGGQVLESTKQGQPSPQCDEQLNYYQSLEKTTRRSASGGVPAWCVRGRSRTVGASRVALLFSVSLWRAVFVFVAWTA